jgi:TRAP-type C4-dicarboxylate transport system substrate-binding protein
MAVAARAASTVNVVSSRTNESSALLANIEASWAKLPASEQHEVYQQLEAIQKRDWKELTTDEKKAGEYAICSRI